MFAGQTRTFKVPAQGTTHALDAIGGHRFSVAGTPQHHSAFRLAKRHRQRCGPNKQRIVNRRFGIGPVIGYFMTQVGKELLDLLLVPESRMVRADGDSHCRSSLSCTDSRTVKRDTVSSSMSTDLSRIRSTDARRIASRPIANAPMANAPMASAPTAIAPTATAPEAPAGKVTLPGRLRVAS